LRLAARESVGLDVERELERLENVALERRRVVGDDLAIVIVACVAATALDGLDDGPFDRR
jgi:hypothetical protein